MSRQPVAISGQLSANAQFGASGGFLKRCSGDFDVQKFDIPLFAVDNFALRIIERIGVSDEEAERQFARRVDSQRIRRVDVRSFADL